MSAAAPSAGASSTAAAASSGGGGGGGSSSKHSKGAGDSEARGSTTRHGNEGGGGGGGGKSKKSSHDSGGGGGADSDSESDSSEVDVAKALADSAEKSELAAYLSTPSTYVSSTPGLELSASEQAARAEVEELLGRLKGHQRELMSSRAVNARELDAMKAAVRKVRRDTDDLMKSQQTNLATMGRKLR